MSEHAQFVFILVVFVSPALLALAGLCMVGYARFLLECSQQVEHRVNVLLAEFCAGVNRDERWDVLAKNLDELNIKLTRNPLPKPTHEFRERPQ